MAFGLCIVTSPTEVSGKRDAGETKPEQARGNVGKILYGLEIASDIPFVQENFVNRNVDIIPRPDRLSEKRGPPPPAGGEKKKKKKKKKKGFLKFLAADLLVQVLCFAVPDHAFRQQEMGLMAAEQCALTHHRCEVQAQSGQMRSQLHCCLPY